LARFFSRFRSIYRGRSSPQGVGGRLARLFCLSARRGAKMTKPIPANALDALGSEDGRRRVRGFLIALRRSSGRQPPMASINGVDQVAFAVLFFAKFGPPSSRRSDLEMPGCSFSANEPSRIAGESPASLSGWCARRGRRDRAAYLFRLLVHHHRAPACECRNLPWAPMRGPVGAVDQHQHLFAVPAGTSS